MRGRCPALLLARPSRLITPPNQLLVSVTSAADQSAEPTLTGLDSPSLNIRLSSMILLPVVVCFGVGMPALCLGRGHVGEGGAEVTGAAPHTVHPGDVVLHPASIIEVSLWPHVTTTTILADLSPSI